MVIKEYGDSGLPKVILLHPMPADGSCMLHLTESMKGMYFFIAPDLSAREKIPENMRAHKRKCRR